MKLLSIIYYFGIFACGIQGSQKSYKHHMLLCFHTSFLASLGGGLCRDLFILLVFPVAFTKSSLPEITIVICSIFFYRICQQKHAIQNILKPFVTLTDALGLGTFIAIGIDHALDSGTSPIIALCSGIITALGGGILSSLLCGQSIYKILTTNISYRIITILGAIIYIYSLVNGIDKTVAQYGLILYTLTFVMITNYNLKTILIKYQMDLFQLPSKIIILSLMDAMLYPLNVQYIHSTKSFYSLNNFDYLKNKTYYLKKNNYNYINYKSYHSYHFPRNH